MPHKAARQRGGKEVGSSADAKDISSSSCAAVASASCRFPSGAAPAPAASAASKRAASPPPPLPPDERNADKRQKVEHGNGGGAAASSAAASAVPAPASAFASADAASSSASAAAAAAAPPLEPLECSIFKNTFQCEEKEGEPSRIPRILPCARHEYCSDGVLKLLAATPGSGTATQLAQLHWASSPTPNLRLTSRLPAMSCASPSHVQCSEGCGLVAVPVPAGVAAAGMASPPDWLPLLPPSKALVTSLRNTRALEVQLARNGASCTYPACSEEVTHWCDECQGELCAAHEASRHLVLVGHTRVPIEGKAAHLKTVQARVYGPAAAKVRAEARLRFEQHQKALAEQQAKLAALQQEVERQHRAVEAEKAAVENEGAVATQLTGVSDEEAIEIAAQMNAHGPAASRSAAATGLLAGLGDELFAHLTRFLKGHKLDGARLLYRASEHGFEAADFWQRCAGKASTLVLVQVAGNGNLIGAFTPGTWLTDSQPGHRFVGDSSLSTCLLSLCNVHGRACRLQLKQDRCRWALYSEPACGPGYGGGADLQLMHEKAANEPGGCQSFPHSFELDHAAEREAGLPPLPFAYTKGLLGGDNGCGHMVSNFPAAEVECWQHGYRSGFAVAEVECWQLR